MNQMNPFGKKVSIDNLGMLCGRWHELRRIYSALAAKQCMSLFGWPSIGKTSLLKCLPSPVLQQRFGQRLEHRLFVYIDLDEHLLKTAKEFFETLCHYIVVQSRGQESLKLVHDVGRGEEGFSDLLEQIDEQGFHLVLELDSFDAIIRNTHFDVDFLAFLRAQVNMRSVSYVTASIAPLHKISQHFTVGSPFFNIFWDCRLGPLEPNEARTLIQMTPYLDDAQETGSVSAKEKVCLFSEKEIEWVLELAGLHPFFIQRVCYYLYEGKLSESATQVTQNDIREEVYRSLLPIFSYIWKNVSVEEQDLLKYEAQREGVQQRKLAELAGSALFRQFVREECHIQPVDLFTELKEILERIEDTKFLGESKLVHLNVVSQNYKQDTAPSIMEKGLAVRQVLKEAFERLRGTGIRTDMEPDWNFYNILYYRYFRLHLKNGQIAARLGFSTRHYYRYHEKALKAFSEVIEDMERSINGKDRG